MSLITDLIGPNSFQHVCLGLNPNLAKGRVATGDLEYPTILHSSNVNTRARAFVDDVITI